MSTIKTIAAQLYLENSLLQKDHADELMSMLSVPYIWWTSLGPWLWNWPSCYYLVWRCGTWGTSCCCRSWCRENQNSKEREFATQHRILSQMIKHFPGKVTIWLSQHMLLIGSRTNKLFLTASIASSLLEEVSALLLMMALQNSHR